MVHRHIYNSVLKQKGFVWREDSQKSTDNMFPWIHRYVTHEANKWCDSLKLSSSHFVGGRWICGVGIVSIVRWVGWMLGYIDL